MWKLILVFFILSFLVKSKERSTLIILDDCDKWNKVSRGKFNNHFSYLREVEKIGLVGFIFGWIDEDYRLSTKSLTFSEIRKSEPLYTSQFSINDWYSLPREYERVFILAPEDYCSEKRFLHDYEFTVYEVILNVTASTDDVITEPLNLLPLPEVDLVRRKKKD
jgi:hypothetical protein